MIYLKEEILKNGKTVLIRNGTAQDGEEVLKVFCLTHEETDNLLTYPDENSFTIEDESEFLCNKEKSPNEIEIVAVVDGKIIGTAGFEAVGTKCKIRHRAEFGISILKEYWGMGIGKVLTNACIECAAKAGFSQLELEAVSENSRATELYKRCGFVEYGRNPKGFLSRSGEYQELVYMRKEL